MSHLTPSDTAIAFLDALQERDFERAARLLSGERFEYVGPTASWDQAGDFIADISRVGPILKRLDRRQVFADGGNVMVVFDFIATIPELSNSRVAEWFRVEDGLITRIEVFFDSYAYRSMFETGTPV